MAHFAAAAVVSGMASAAGATGVVAAAGFDRHASGSLVQYSTDMRDEYRAVCTAVSRSSKWYLYSDFRNRVVCVYSPSFVHVYNKNRTVFVPKLSLTHAAF